MEPRARRPSQRHDENNVRCRSTPRDFGFGILDFGFGAVSEQPAAGSGALWYEITAQTPPSLVEEVSALMLGVAPGGITVEHPIDILGPEMGFVVRGGEPVLVRAYLPASELGAVLVSDLRDGMEDYPSVQLTAKPIYEQDWSVSWREFFGVVETGGRLVVVPTWIEHEVKPGQRVTLVLPDARRPGGTPRLLPLTVAATFEAGHYEYDSTMALMRLDDARTLLGLSGPSGLQLRLADRDRAGEVGWRLAGELPPGLIVSDWTRTNRQWFESVQIQKRMLFLILALIVAVAAFNLVSMLVMTVTDKQSDIAILRTLGATPRSVMGIFVVQGAASGVIGTLAGLLLGLLLAFNIGRIVPAIEALLGTTLLPANIYLIDHMPSDPRLSDIVPIVVISLLLSFVATLYPSWRASRVEPAQALRHE